MSGKSNKVSRLSSQAGFTIVELMIATLVFSVVLVIITVGVLHFTNSYYKGVNSSTTQTAAQNAIDTITQAIQFGGNGTASQVVTAGEGVFCAGSELFLYSPGVEYTGGTPGIGNWGLYMIDNPNTANCIKPGPVPSTGKELLGKTMRVADFNLSRLGAGQTNPWSVALRIAYGDADLLCSQAANSAPKGGCLSTSVSYNPSDTFAASDMQCRSQVGSEFCSVSALTAVAQQRIVN